MPGFYRKNMTEEIFDDLKDAVHLDENKLIEWCEQHPEISFEEKLHRLTAWFIETMKKLMN